ncbi:MAG: UbiX family flavin prenyltransferase [Chloroflexi bacterium]|nr:UbiX family flavin prenyltransferase [Chloroflexota bacterium]
MAIYVVGITGGSGFPYAQRLLQSLLVGGHEVKLVVSPAGERVVEIESGFNPSGDLRQRERQWVGFLEQGEDKGRLELLAHMDFAASIASGSFPTAGMVVVPCSMGTLARIAMGASSNLIERAADVTLKERRKLILVPRETPLSRIHLRNMLLVSEAGAEVLPAMPGFYHRPSTIGDLVNMLVGRILDRLGVESPLSPRWRGAPEPHPLELDE